MATSDLQVVPATVDLVASMEGRLRHHDVAECHAAADMSGEEGLRCSFEASKDNCFIALWKGKATVCFGAAEMTPVIGAPWLLATDDIHDMAYTFLLDSQKWVDKVGEPFALLLNWVDARNDISIKWLLRVGFTIGQARPYGPFGAMFHPFWKRGGTTGCCSKCKGD